MNQLNQNDGISFLVHGFQQNCDVGWAMELMKVLAGVGPSNVCCLDWSEWASRFYFDSPTTYVPLVSEYFAQVISRVQQNYQGMHIDLAFGHSLGAHIVSEASELIPDEPLQLCVGADPAGPGYPPVKLVGCVKMITFCCEKYIFGSATIVGDVAIYMNGGANQPQCSGNIFCDHITCPNFFTEAIRPNKCCQYVVTNIATGAQSYFDPITIPDGSYSMRTSKCFPYCTVN